jgi:hypothetical protein
MLLNLDLFLQPRTVLRNNHKSYKSNLQPVGPEKPSLRFVQSFVQSLWRYFAVASTLCGRVLGYAPTRKH